MISINTKKNISTFLNDFLIILCISAKIAPSIQKKINMRTLLTRYASVGVVNTIIHWAVFAGMCMSGIQQSWANLAAFCVAVTFSFFANARWTFNSQATSGRYILYVLFMGILAAAVGRYSDDMKINPIITLVSFSAISLLCGFVYSKFVIFREKK